jgi:hypothetical protein
VLSGLAKQRIAWGMEESIEHRAGTSDAGKRRHGETEIRGQKTEDRGQKTVRSRL